MLPAGEMWSVVTESPKIPKQRAWVTAGTGIGWRVKLAKKGGS